jgi:hypothetical protein
MSHTRTAKKPSAARSKRTSPRISSKSNIRPFYRPDQCMVYRGDLHVLTIIPVRSLDETRPVGGLNIR